MQELAEQGLSSDDRGCPLPCPAVTPWPGRCARRTSRCSARCG